MSAPPLRVSICACTIGRPLGVRRLVESIGRLRFDAARVQVTLVVCDNDPGHAARPLLESLAGTCPLPMIIVHEPVRGVAAARNRSLAAAEQADFIAFIDDDEWPAPDWLAKLLEVQQRHDADVVVGTILPRYDEPLPAWFRCGGFHRRPRYPTGTRLRSGSTGNALIRRTALGSRPDPFDQRFGLSGGSDALLIDQLLRGGATIVRADEAIVHEAIPPSRATVRWVLRRAYRVGTARAAIRRERHGAAAALVISLAIAAVRAAAASMLIIPAALWRGRAGAVHQLRWFAYAAGLSVGATGRLATEYDRIHGR